MEGEKRLGRKADCQEKGLSLYEEKMTCDQKDKGDCSRGKGISR